MNLVPDIINSIVFLYEMEAIKVYVPELNYGTPLQFTITEATTGKILLDEQYFPDFDNYITVDIRDFITDEFKLSIPLLNSEIQQNNFIVLHINVGTEIEGNFTVNGFSEDVKSRMSDIDFLRVPADFQIPVSAPNMGIMDRAEIWNPGQGGEYEDVFVTNESGKGTVTRFISMDEDSHYTLSSYPFWIQLSIDGVEGWLKSPVFKFQPGNFQQYLFANRYGGFDNVPMDGALKYVPDTEHSAGIYAGQVKQISSNSESIYEQNSGYLTRKTMIAMAELICSRQIYHLVAGVWRRIVILESNLSANSVDNLHSFSFKYKYADDLRPIDVIK